MMPVNVYFIRHGETDYNRQGLIQGQINIPLNEKGRSQAAEAAQYFRKESIVFDRVYASPLIRAKETASIVSGWTMERIQTDERVQEMAFGAAEGLNFYTLPEGIMNLFRNPPAYEVPEGGESIDDLKARCQNFLDALAETADREPSIQNVMVVTHGAALRGLLSCIENTSREQFWKKGLLNCCIVRVRLEEGIYTLESIE